MTKVVEWIKGHRRAIIAWTLVTLAWYVVIQATNEPGFTLGRAAFLLGGGQVAMMIGRMAARPAGTWISTRAWRRDVREAGKVEMVGRLGDGPQHRLPLWMGPAASTLYLKARYALRSAGRWLELLGLTLGMPFLAAWLAAAALWMDWRRGHVG